MFDLFDCTAEELLASRLAAEDEQRRLDARTAVIDAELERRGTCDREFGHGTGSWLAARRDLPVGICRHRASVAAKVATHLPLVHQALADARISWEHARVIADAANPRILHLIADIQGVLIEQAHGKVFARWKRWVQTVAEELDADGGHDPNRERPGQFHTSPIIDGQLHVFGALNPDIALTFRTELDRLTDQLFRQATRDHHTTPELALPSRGELQAQALGEMARRSAARNLNDSAPPRPEIVVCLNGETGDVTILDGVPVMPDTLRRLLPDAIWRAMWLDQHRVPLDLGRSQRTVSHYQRLALGIRDGGCIFPGCDRPAAWCDAHHVEEWKRDDGPTDLINLGLMCRHHHGVTHRTGWTMAAVGDGTFTWTTASGETLRSQRHGQQQEVDPDGELCEPNRQLQPFGA